MWSGTWETAALDSLRHQGQVVVGGFKGKGNPGPGVLSRMDESHTRSSCSIKLWAPFIPRESDDEVLRMFSPSSRPYRKGQRPVNLVIPCQSSPSTEAASLTSCLGKKLLPFCEPSFTGRLGHSPPLAGPPANPALCLPSSCSRQSTDVHPPLPGLALCPPIRSPSALLVRVKN